MGLAGLPSLLEAPGESGFLAFCSFCGLQPSASLSRHSLAQVTWALLGNSESPFNL